MMRLFFLGFFTFFFLIFSYANEKAGSILLLTDFDETLIRSIQSPWHSYYVLARIENIHSTIQLTEEYKKSPDRFPITTENFYKIQPYLGQGPERINSVTPIPVKTKGIVDLDLKLLPKKNLIVPGYYSLSPRMSFKRFRHNEEVNYLLEEYLATKQRQAQDKRSFFGITYGLFEWLMKNPSKGEISIHTARGQNKEDFVELFDAFVKNGDLKQMHQQFRVHAVHSLESRMVGRNVAEKKVNSVEMELQQFFIKPIKKEGEGFIHVNKRKALQGERQRRHLVIVADDDPQFAYDLFKKTRQLSQESPYRNKIKFVFIHSGVKSAVNNDGLFKGYRIFVFDNGFHRPIVEEELKELYIPREMVQRFGIKYLRPKVSRSHRIPPPPSRLKKTESNCKKSFEKEAS